MLEAGVLHEDDRIELIDGELLIMAPIGDTHEETTDWLNWLCGRAFGERAMVRVQGSIRLNNMSAPQPDIAILRRRRLGDARPYFPEDIFVVIEVANTSLRYDSGPKLAPVCRGRHRRSVDCQSAKRNGNGLYRPVGL